MEQFLPQETHKRQTLQDAILEKIKERRTEVMSGIHSIIMYLYKLVHGQVDLNIIRANARGSVGMPPRRIHALRLHLRAFFDSNLSS